MGAKKEIQVNILRQYLCEGMSYNEIGKKIECSAVTTRNYIKEYFPDIYESRRKNKEEKKANLKKEINKMFEEKVPQCRIARNLGISTAYVNSLLREKKFCEISEDRAVEVKRTMLFKEPEGIKLSIYGMNYPQWATVVQEYSHHLVISNGIYCQCINKSDIFSGKVVVKKISMDIM